MDPICGMTVDPATALKVERDGETPLFLQRSTAGRSFWSYRAPGLHSTPTPGTLLCHFPCRSCNSAGQAVAGGDGDRSDLRNDGEQADGDPGRARRPVRTTSAATLPAEVSGVRRAVHDQPRHR